MKVFVCLLLMWMSCRRFADANPTLIKLGALFGHEAKIEKRALDLAIELINRDDSLLPGAVIRAVTRTLNNDMALDALDHACDLARVGVTMIIAVTSCPIHATLQSISEALHIPVLPIGGQECEMWSRSSNFTLKTEPRNINVVDALFQYIHHERIRNCIFVHESDVDVETAKHITYRMLEENAKGFPANTFLRVDISSREDGRDRFQHSASHLTRLFETIKIDAFILLAHPRTVFQLLSTFQESHPRQSFHMKWIIPGHRFLMDQLKELEKSSASYITVLNQYLNDRSRAVQSFVTTWFDHEQGSVEGSPGHFEVTNIPEEAFYIYDAVRLLSAALTENMRKGSFVSATHLQCGIESMRSWQGGEPLMQTLRQLIVTKSSLHDDASFGFAGETEFATLMKMSGWNRTFVEGRLLKSNVNSSSYYRFTDHNVNMTLRVATIEEAPFVVIKRSSDGKVHFDGFAIDLIQILAKNMGIKVEIYEVEDKKYGSQLPNGSWNGLIGDVIKGKADIAVAAMTITADREEVVDFARRYMDYSVGIVFKRPQLSTDFFSFVAPFDISVWFCIVSAIIVVVAFIYILNQISPTRCVALSNRCDQQLDVMDVKSVFWFAYSSLMQQGSDLPRVSFPARIAVGFWWLFILTVISSYTANLAAFLTVKKMDTPIRSFSDLVKQQSIQYGTVPDTSIHNFIMKKALEGDDPSSFYGTMSRVVNKSSNRVVDTRAGFDRSATENFAFLWDVQVIDYEVANHRTCAIVSLSDSIYHKGYGFALQRGSPIRDKLSLGILHLQDSGMIEELQQKWWPRSGQCSADSKPPSSGQELTLEMFTGVFFVLAAGLTLASFCAVAEIIVYVWKGNTYPPTTACLRRKNKNDDKENDVILALSKKDLMQQLVLYLANDGRPDADNSSEKLSKSSSANRSLFTASEEMTSASQPTLNASLAGTFPQTSNYKRIKEQQSHHCGSATLPRTIKHKNTDEAPAASSKAFDLQRKPRPTSSKKSRPTLLRDFAAPTLESIEECNQEVNDLDLKLPSILRKSEI